MIGDPITLSYSVHKYRYFGPKTNIDEGSLQLTISALSIIKMIPCGCCGVPGHKDDLYIIRGPNFLPTSLIIHNNQYNSVLWYKPYETPN